MRTVQTKVVAKLETHILCSIIFLRKLCRLWDNVEKYGTAGVTLPMRIACWIPKATNTFRICNTYSFFMATMVARTHISVALYVHCLSCWVNFQLNRSKQVAVAILLAVCPIHKQSERKITRNFLQLFAWIWRVCSGNTFMLQILSVQLRNRCVG